MARDIENGLELEARDVRLTAADVGRAIDLTIKVVDDAYRELFPT